MIIYCFFNGLNFLQEVYISVLEKSFYLAVTYAVLVIYLVYVWVPTNWIIYILNIFDLLYTNIYICTLTIINFNILDDLYNCISEFVENLDSGK